MPTPAAWIDHLVAELWAGLSEMRDPVTRQAWIVGMLDAIEGWEALERTAQ